MGELQQYVVKGGKRLRMGYTTGSCAAGAAKAAAEALLGQTRPAAVRLLTPRGVALELDVEQLSVDGGTASCAIRKDAGDDPDVTDGALVFATVSLTAAGISVLGGQGVGRVTRRGLPCPVGAAAINPVPERMIRQVLEEVKARHGYHGGLEAVISVPEGVELAKRTFNPRLGIEGGISILGTSGLVEPMSEAAIVETIRAEIDTVKATGKKVLLLMPGNYGKEFAQRDYGVTSADGVKCSNYIGEALDYAVYREFESIVLLGHAGKLVKLAAGIMNTHSSVADGRMEVLACHGALAGLPTKQVERLYACITVDEAGDLLEEWGESAQVWRRIGQRIQYQLDYRVKARAEIAFAAFLSVGIVMESGPVRELLNRK